jgi:hypothetical protein
MDIHSVAETVVAEAVLEGSLVNAEEVVHKNYIRQIQYRVKHNIFYIQNQIQNLQNNLMQEESKLEILNELLGEIPESSEEDEDSYQETESDNSDQIIGVE